MPEHEANVIKIPTQPLLLPRERDNSKGSLEEWKEPSLLNNVDMGSNPWPLISHVILDKSFRLSELECPHLQ